MRCKVLFFASLALAPLTVGCSEPEPQPKAAETRSAEAKASVKAGVQATVEATQDYAYAKRAEFVLAMEKQLGEAQQEVDRLSAQVGAATGEAQAEGQSEAKARLDALRDKVARSKVRLEAARSATESTWEDVKTGFKLSYGDLKESVDGTRSWMSEKIAPKP